MMLKKYIAYIKDNPNKYWFKRKIYGWGWTPATWQGWVIMCGYSGAVLGLALRIDEQKAGQDVLYSFFLPFVLLSTVLIAITYKNGEKPQWQWGIPKEYKK